MREWNCGSGKGPEDDDEDDDDLDVTGVWQLPAPAAFDCADGGPEVEEVRGTDR